MKITGYREQLRLDGVALWGRVALEVPLSDVLSERLAPVVPAEVLRIGEHGAASEDPPSTRWPFAPQRFRFRGGQVEGGAEIEAEGLLHSESLVNALEFLERRYLPDEGSDRRVDVLVTQVRRGELCRADFVRSVEAMVLAEVEHRSARRVPFPTGDEPVGSWRPPLLVAGAERLDEIFAEREDPGGVAWLARLPHGAALAVVAPWHDVAAGAGERLPRLRFVLSDSYDRGFACWDGRRYRVAAQLEELPSSLRRTLEREGQLFVGPPEWFLPLPDLRPDLLVRLPSRDEVAHLGEAPQPGRLPAPPRAGFLVDLRRPIALPRAGSLPRLEDPLEALAVLARTTARGAYIPELPPAALQDLDLPPPGAPPVWAALCWLR